MSRAENITEKVHLQLKARKKSVVSIELRPCGGVYKRATFFKSKKEGKYKKVLRRALFPRLHLFQRAWGSDRKSCGATKIVGSFHALIKKIEKRWKSLQLGGGLCRGGDSEFYLLNGSRTL